MAETRWDTASVPRTLPEGYVIDGFSALPGETAESFERYQQYRDLGPGRTYAAVTVAAGASRSGLNDTAHREHWKMRAAAFDRAVVEEEQKALHAAMERHAEKLVSRRMEIQETEYQNYLKIQQKTDIMLSWPTFLKEESRDGKTIKYIPYKWSATSLAQLMEQGSVLARRSTEMPTSYSQVDINANTSLDISTAHMTPEEQRKHEQVMAFLGEQYQAMMAGDDVAALTARVVEAEPVPPSWYKEEADVHRDEHESGPPEQPVRE